MIALERPIAFVPLQLWLENRHHLAVESASSRSPLKVAAHHELAASSSIPRPGPSCVAIEQQFSISDRERNSIIALAPCVDIVGSFVGGDGGVGRRFN